MSGSYMTSHGWSEYVDGDAIYFASTGTYPYIHVEHGSPNYDYVWEQMYVHPKPVIIVCGYCMCHNVISNPTCIQCGAPMGYGTERHYG